MLDTVLPEISVDPIARGATHGLVVCSELGVAAMAPRLIEQRARSRSSQLHRIGIISNKRSHRNRMRGAGSEIAQCQGSGILYRAPRTLPNLWQALFDFAEAGIELLVVDGGDGTLRDVITCASQIFPGRFPRLAIVPSGKTNALAFDLGIPPEWTVDDALEAAAGGKFKLRSPIEILRRGSAIPDLRGFVFGAGAFVLATGLAQRTHKAGAFKGLAVGLSLAWAIAQTLFGARDNIWRAGERMRIQIAGGRRTDRHFYVLFGSTLKRLPLGLKPFGRVRDGFKLLAIDAPPERLLRTVSPLLTGSEATWLDRAGYHRADVDSFELSLDGGFILDGEFYAGGDLTVRRGASIPFVVP